MTVQIFLYLQNCFLNFAWKPRKDLATVPGGGGVPLPPVLPDPPPPPITCHPRHCCQVSPWFSGKFEKKNSAKDNPKVQEDCAELFLCFSILHGKKYIPPLRGNYLKKKLINNQITSCLFVARLFHIQFLFYSYVVRVYCIIVVVSSLNIFAVMAEQKCL